MFLHNLFYAISVASWHLSFVCKNDEGADKVIPDIIPVWNKVSGIQGKSLLGFHTPEAEKMIAIRCGESDHLQPRWNAGGQASSVLYDTERHQILRKEGQGYGSTVDLEGIEEVNISALIDSMSA